MDLIGVCLEPSLGVGQRLTLATIDRHLRQLPLQQSLLLLSEVCFKAERLPRPPHEEHIEFARQVLPASWLPRAEPLLARTHPRTAAISPQLVVLLAIRLLSVSDGSAAEVEDSASLARRLGRLSVALADHVEDSTIDRDSTILELVRLGLLFSSHEHPGWLSLSGRIFFDVLPTLEDHPDWMNPFITFRRRTGIELDRFWAMTCVQGIAAAESETNFMFPLNIAQHPVEEEELNAWLRLLAHSIDEAQELARSDAAKPIGWSVDTFWKRPLIEIGNANGPVVRPRLLQMQAEPAQMFWHVRDALVAEGVSHLAWSRLFGEAAERVGVQLAREHCVDSEVFDEAEFVARWQVPLDSMRADVAIVSPGGAALVADFVARQFTRDTTSTGDFTALASDLRVGVIEKLEQVDATLARAISAEPGLEKLYPLAVTVGQLPYVPPLDEVINEELAELNLKVIGKDPRCRPWLAMDFLNFELLFRSARLLDVSWVDLIGGWQESELARNTFRAWLLLDGPGSQLEGGGLPDDWIARITDYLHVGN